jgi:AbrB family looped-hinge helix DNA binding protein
MAEETTRLSSKGQVVIPKSLRDAYHWQPGQEFVVLDTGDGLLLKEKLPFAPTSLDEVAGSLPASGAARTPAEMEQAIQKGVAARFGRTQDDSTP